MTTREGARFDRGAFRSHALDGALLLFQPSSGLSVRLDAPSVRGLRRRAPRVVLFSLSHACNLRCGFCSRDAGLRARWPEEEAFALLAALAEAGTLEVAFGGGEPLAHASLLPLLRRLREGTPLALHLTTNGSLLDEATAAALAPLASEVRVSIYEEQPWDRAIGRLREAGIRAAANVLVDPDRLEALPGLLEQLAALGCANVALLRYLGADPGRSLRGEEWRRLEEVIALAPLPIRLSHCFADRMPALPRLFGEAQADCGAGRDFLVIEPDRHLRACSFHPHREPFADAAELLLRYRSRAPQDPLGEAVRAEGCARPFPPAAPLPDGIRLFSGFSSNNSGDTVLVARFAEAREPRRLAEALAELDPERDVSAWKDFLRAEGADPEQRDYERKVAAAGRALLATGYDAYDALPGLREVLVRRGAVVVESGVHVHGPLPLLVAIEGAGGDEAMRAALREIGAEELERKGQTLLATFTEEEEGWAEPLRRAEALAAEAGLPFGAELLKPGSEWDEEEVRERLVEGCQATVKEAAPEASPGYLKIHFGMAKRAQAFASSLEGGRFSVAGATLLLELDRPRARIARKAHRAGGISCWVPRDRLRVLASFYRDYREAPVLPEEVQRAIAATAARPPTFALRAVYRSTLATLETESPHTVMKVLVRAAEALGVSLGVDLRPARPLAHAIARIRRDLRVL